MKKMFLLFLGVIFSAPFTQATTADYRAAASADGQFSVYGNKKSAWCNVMRASQCANPAGFQKYLEKGCINDIDKESKCLKTFCAANCASIQGCPQERSPLKQMCDTHCTKVNLGNVAAQNRLNACVVGSLNAGDASRKSASRDFYRAQQKDLSSMNKAGLKEAQGVLDLVNRLSQQRAKLFYVESSSLKDGGIIRIDDFINNIKTAINLTKQMNSAVNGLAVSGQSPEILAKARALMAKSDQQVQFFVKVVQELSKGANILLQTVAQGSGGPGARSDGYQNVPGYGA